MWNNNSKSKVAETYPMNNHVSRRIPYISDIKMCTVIISLLYEVVCFLID